MPGGISSGVRHGKQSWQIEGKTVKYWMPGVYCEWFNLLGTPATMVPMAYSAEGLPVGVQIIARPWQEELVLSIAELLEAEQPANKKLLP